MTNYYFIRHAEKNRNVATPDPHLTSTGRERAKRWADFFSDKNIDQIFCTNFKRTSETAQPTAKQEGIEIQTYQGIVNFVDKFRRKTENKNVLIVGHQDTTPHFVNSILDQKKYKMIRASEHGKVFHLTLDKEGRLVKEQVLEVE